ncbi:MAG: CapA family protein [Acidimicrobiales bacterium]|nr:CapA family protein [Acidimicrobiales bacterium]
MLLAGACSADEGRAPLATEGTTPALPSGLPTDATTATSAAPTANPGDIVIHAVGDVMLSTAFADVEPDFSDLLSDMGGLFTTDDLTIANLECPVAESGEPIPERPFALRCDVAGLEPLANAGVDVVNVANDATGDYGVEAQAETIERAEAAGLTVIGTDADPAIVQLGPHTAALFGFSVVGPDATDAAAITAAIRAEADNDLVLVSIHWGEPEDRDPNPSEVDLAEQLVNAGADAVYGHGPHRLQSLRQIQNRWVAFSLGHFVWPLNNPNDPDSTVALTTVTPDGRIASCLLPATIRTDGRPALDRPDAGCDVAAEAALGSPSTTVPPTSGPSTAPTTSDG